MASRNLNELFDDGDSSPDHEKLENRMELDVVARRKEKKIIKLLHRVPSLWHGKALDYPLPEEEVATLRYTCCKTGLFVLFTLHLPIPSFAHLVFLSFAWYRSETNPFCG